MRSIFHPDQEQALLLEFFNKTTGVFVDVGANDPILNSQSYHLEKLGWKGVLVEPLPQYAERLRKERTARVYESACGPPEQHGNMALLKVAGVYSSVSENLMVPEGEIEGTVQVKLITLQSILEDAGITHIDLLSIDVEGYEIEVLRGLDLAKFRPCLILLEDHVLDFEKHHYMSSNGYKLVRRTGINSWYVPREQDFFLGFWGRWQLFRKYVIGTPIRRLRYECRKNKVKDR